MNKPANTRTTSEPCSAASCAAHLCGQLRCGYLRSHLRKPPARPALELSCAATLNTEKQRREREGRGVTKDRVGPPPPPAFDCLAILFMSEKRRQALERPCHSQNKGWDSGRLVVAEILRFAAKTKKENLTESPKNASNFNIS